MSKIPLGLRLKREIHKRIAYAQDLILEEVYKKIGNAVLHGGTAIWRCYSGRRFSEDLDFYFPRNEKKIREIFSSLESKGFKIKKLKISSRSVYSLLEYERTPVRLEATFQKIKFVLCDYEFSNGNFSSIYSLTPDQFLSEKCNTYLKRFKIRDLWDIFFLLNKIEDLKKIKEIEKLIKKYKKPIDEEALKLILLEGVVPSSDLMFDYIKRKWENKYI
ncbi:MAG: nucleotidyl transferase AbiEii/AbiGii toxin family protein [Nanoarchaeota archaeon]|nr:nucleotidyl transferase AbiEii/AbiGii toxin family protein [Nanoarchaeota archaeon]